MSVSGDLQAVLFDSGGVLMQPRGGRWNPRADFEEVVARYAPSTTPGQFAMAIAAGEEFLAASDATPPYEDYLRVVLGSIGLRPAPELLADLQRPVEPAVFLETFPEVPETLAELARRGVRMAVVSDAWPELPALHEGLGIGGFFEAYAISAEVGACKPDARMYRHASDALGLPPSRCLFVDDKAGLVAAAIKLGYAGRVIERGGRPTEGQVPAIQSLTELLDLF